MSFIVKVTHETGEFLARTRVAESRQDALVHVANEATDRWSLDILEVAIATEADIREANGQITELETEV